jgi:hypothetical protein
MEPALPDQADSLVEAGVQRLIIALGGDGYGHDLAPLRVSSSPGATI